MINVWVHIEGCFLNLFEYFEKSNYFCLCIRLVDFFFTELLRQLSVKRKVTVNNSETPRCLYTKKIDP